MFTNSKIKNTVLWLLIIMICSFSIAGSIYISERNKGNFLKTVQHKVDEEKTESYKGIDLIDITSVSEDVKIITWDGSRIKAHLYGTTVGTPSRPAPELDVSASGNTLVIKVKQKIKIGFNLGLINDSLSMDVYVPKDYKNKLKVTTTSAEMSADGALTLEELRYKSVSGGITLNNLKTSRTYIGTTSGEADINGFSGDMDFHSVSGSLSLNYNEFANNINIETTSGEASVRLPQNAGFDLDFKSVSGELKSEFPFTAQKIKGSKITGGTSGKGGNKISFKSVSGDFELTR